MDRQNDLINLNTIQERNTMTMRKIPHRIYLNEDQMPTQWYNLRADMKELPDPLINPATKKPATEEDLYPVFWWRDL